MIRPGFPSLDNERMKVLFPQKREDLIDQILLKQHPTEDEQTLKLTAVMLSWGMYGASVEWRRSGQEIPPEEYIKSALPYILREKIGEVEECGRSNL